MSSRSRGDSADDRVDERNRARNQALIRELNEQVSAFAANGTTGDDVLVICECTEVGCSAPVSLAPAEYERIRRSATHFIVKPGHSLPDGERVVEETAAYAIVEKLGEGADIAARLDPRRLL
jgi:hypothetical protein